MSLVSELIACDRETGLKGSFKDFVKLAWPQVFPSSPFQDNWHIGLLCEHYEACLRGEIDELVVNLPPGGSKSSLTCVLFPAWGWIQKPGSSWITAAYGQKLVRRDAAAMLALIQSPWWQRRWGDRFKVPTVPAIDLIKNSQGGFRLGTTPGGEVTGFHANYQIIDDPNKPEELTKVGLESVKDWLGRTMGSRWRRPPEVNSRIVIMQRLHCDDLSQVLLDRGAVHICLPATYDPGRKTVTKWGQDPRTEVGELLDHVRLPQKILDQKRIELGGINYAAQYDQSPVPEGGAVFQRSWLKFYQVRPPQFDQVVCSWDCAFKDEETSDFVAGQVWGRVGAHFYLLEQVHGHFNFGATVKKVNELIARWRAHASVVLIEDKANGTAVIETLSKAIPGIVAVDPRGGKFSRASACSGLFEAGNVFLPDPALPGNAWVDTTLIPELLSFPRAKHDDQVDAATQALLYLQENTSYLKAAMARVRAILGVVDADAVDPKQSIS